MASGSDLIHGLPKEEWEKLSEEEKAAHLKKQDRKAGAEAAGGILSGIGGSLGASPGGPLAQTPGVPGKGSLGSADPLMRTAGDRTLRGRGFKKGGSVKSRDGVAIKGKTKGRFV